MDEPGEPLARLLGVTIDVHDLEREKAFWQEVLAARVAEENEVWVIFEPQAGCAALSLQKVGEDKKNKNRAHPDLKLADFESGVRRMQELGARAIRHVTSPNGLEWFIMADPDGNEFCAIR